MNSLTFDYTGANVLVTGGTAGIGNGRSIRAYISNSDCTRTFQAELSTNG